LHSDVLASFATMVIWFTFPGF